MPVDLLTGVQLVQVATPSVPEVGLGAVDLAGQMARQLGAEVFVDSHFEIAATFRGRGKRRLPKRLESWLGEDKSRIPIFATTDSNAPVAPVADVSQVVLHADALASEATLFAESGLADLLGDPERAPLIPKGDYAAGTVAFAVLAAVTSLVALRRRSGRADTAAIEARSVLSWVNWKAAVAGMLGNDLCREGARAEWPVVPCRDGYAALIFQERDWNNIVAMVGDERLADERFASFRGRAANRDAYMQCIRAWAATRSKAEMRQAFFDHGIPAAPVLGAEDLLDDPLLNYRDAFVPVTRKGGLATRSPRLAHRVAASSERDCEHKPSDDGLPLSGMRVLDLGIITAGAGVSALLADLGAEVLKIESHTYPDPFRAWAGQAVSPFFKSNNRNKFGLALDLKTEADRARFLALVESADVVVENFRRGVMERLGLGYETLQSVNPSIMLASISGQGLDGPGAEASSFGSTLEASSGFSARLSYDDGVPYTTGRNINYPDQTVVLYAAAVITAALSGCKRGMHLDISQRDVTVFLLGEELEWLSTGKAAQARGAVYNGRAFKSADGQWVAFDDTDAPGVVCITTEQWAEEVSAREIIKNVSSMGVGAAVVNRGSQMHSLETGSGSPAFAIAPDGQMVKGFPFQLERSPLRIRLNSPAVGEHTDQFCP